MPRASRSAAKQAKELRRQIALHNLHLKTAPNELARQRLVKAIAQAQEALRKIE